MSDYLYEDDTYKIIGALIEVHKNLGKGFSEIVYKDAFEYELKRINFSFEREKEYLNGGGKFIVPCPKFEIIGKDGY